MPNKSRIYTFVLVILILASTLSISGLALASPPRLPKADTPTILNRIGVGANQQVDQLTGAGNSIFLPIVSNMPAGIAIPNGDFESGPTIWTEFSTSSRNLILNENNLPVTPLSGSWAAWLGEDLNETSILSQTLTIPAGSPYLTYWHWIDSEEVVCGIDFGAMSIYEEGDPYPDIYVYDLCLDNNTFGWRAYSLDLSEHAGMTRSIEIWAEENNGEYPSSLYVDDVSFKSYPTSSSLIKTRKGEK